MQETHSPAPPYAPAPLKRRRLLRRFRGKLVVAACQLALDVTNLHLIHPAMERGGRIA